uniref:Uncharacterized protein n=1 Tax=Populus trichocarpa TaxID=3694 RepID=A0A3N7G0B8_POPTR
MSMMFFHFLKIIFDISTSKRSKSYDPSQKQSKKHLSWTLQEPFGSDFSSGDVQNGSVVTQADVLAEESSSLFASML